MSECTHGRTTPSFDGDGTRHLRCTNCRMYIHTVEAPLYKRITDLHAQVAQLTEEFGLLKIAHDHKETLLDSCEKALAERDIKVADLQAQVAEVTDLVVQGHQLGVTTDDGQYRYIPKDYWDAIIKVLDRPTASEGAVPVSGRIVGGEPIYDQIGVTEPEGVE